MGSFTGKCRYCGSEINIIAENQEDADRQASRDCSCGGMVLAKAKAIQAAGGNYQDTLKVIAQDLDWTGVYMTYTQLSMAGINAVVIQGDTLTGEKAGALQKFYTPLYVLKCI